MHMIRQVVFGRFATLAITMALPLSASMMAGAQAANLRIGFINTVQVMEQAPQAQAASQHLEQEFEPRRKRLMELKETLSEKRQGGDKDALTMSDSQRGDLENEIEKGERDLQVGEDEFREDLNARKAEEMGKVQSQIFSVIQAMAKEKKYDLIINESGVIYADGKINITTDLLARLKDSQGR
jgi:outer membrane protein